MILVVSKRCSRKENGQCGSTPGVGSDTGVPYSPDDRRPGGKTCVLVEDGTQEEVKKFIEENVLLKEKFSTVFSIHHYNEKEKDL